MIPPFFLGSTFKLIVVAAVGVAGLVAGIKLEGNRWRAKEATRLEAVLKERQVDEAFTLGVSAAYEQVAAQLRRITTVNRVELTREVTKEVYRCPLPDAARGLLNASIDAANAAAGFSDPAVRSDPEADGERPRGTGDSLFGASGDVR
jgi:hypothetical protein